MMVPEAEGGNQVQDPAASQLELQIEAVTSNLTNPILEDPLVKMMVENNVFYFQLDKPLPWWSPKTRNMVAHISDASRKPLLNVHTKWVDKTLVNVESVEKSRSHSKSARNKKLDSTLAFLTDSGLPILFGSWDTVNNLIFRVRTSKIPLGFISYNAHWSSKFSVANATGVDPLFTGLKGTRKGCWRDPVEYKFVGQNGGRPDDEICFGKLEKLKTEKIVGKKQHVSIQLTINPTNLDPYDKALILVAAWVTYLEHFATACAACGQPVGYVGAQKRWWVGGLLAIFLIVGLIIGMENLFGVIVAELSS